MLILSLFRYLLSLPFVDQEHEDQLGRGRLLGNCFSRTEIGSWTRCICYLRNSLLVFARHSSLLTSFYFYNPFHSIAVPVQGGTVAREQGCLHGQECRILVGEQLKPYCGG